jgi:hypothetical protein
MFMRFPRAQTPVFPKYEIGIQSYPILTVRPVGGLSEQHNSVEKVFLQNIIVILSLNNFRISIVNSH